MYSALCFCFYPLLCNARDILYLTIYSRTSDCNIFLNFACNFVHSCNDVFYFAVSPGIFEKSGLIIIN